MDKPYKGTLYSVTFHRYMPDPNEKYWDGMCAGQQTLKMVAEGYLEYTDVLMQHVRRTSWIVKIDLENNSIETMNSIYGIANIRDGSEYYYGLTP